MKNLIYTGIGLVFGIVIGVLASFKIAEKKADKKATDALAEERKAMRENSSDVNTEEKNYSEVSEKTIADFSEKSNEELVSNDYAPSKPYILESMPIGFKEKHEYIDDFDECCVVFDKKRGRVSDEDGCEIFDIKGCLGFNNLNRIALGATVHIVCERDGTVFIVHVGSLEEYMDSEYIEVDE